MTEVVFPPDAPEVRRAKRVGDLRWSPDGGRLAAWWRNSAWPGGHDVSDRSGLCIYGVPGDAEGEGQPGRILLEVAPQGPRMGADGRREMGWYSQGGALPSRAPKTFGSVSWSPDGRTLAFSSDMDSSGDFYVYTISAEGGEPRRVDPTRSAWPQDVMWRPR